MRGAMDRCLGQRGVELIHHSDRGSRYTSIDYSQTVDEQQPDLAVAREVQRLRLAERDPAGRTDLRGRISGRSDE